jgi:tRNA(Ile)-lysidine synthase
LRRKASRTTPVTKKTERPAALSLEGRIAAFCRLHHIFVPGSIVLVAVSGGGDSMSLLRLLCSLAADLDITPHIAHVDHRLRTASSSDAAFVAEHARALALPCSVEMIDVPAARHAADGGLEAVARRLRYAALRSIAARVGAECIATGHSADDQAETVLMHLLRGAGIDGLSGMRPRNGDIARPLLSVSRAEIDSYISAHGIVTRLDESNRDTRLRRNAVRHVLIPALEQFNPRAKEALLRSATTLARDADWVAEHADRTLAALSQSYRGGALILDRPAFAALPIGLRMHVWRHAVQKCAGSTDGLTLLHMDALDSLLIGHASGRQIQLPRALCCEASGDRLRLGPRMATSPPQDATLDVPGSVVFGAWAIRAARPMELGDVGDAGADRRRNVFQITVGAAEVGNRLIVRSARPGDRITISGMAGRKKIQDIFVDKKVPRTIRAHIPVIAGEKGILWVVGHAVAARVSQAADHASVVITAEGGDELW